MKRSHKLLGAFFGAALLAACGSSSSLSSSTPVVPQTAPLSAAPGLPQPLGLESASDRYRSHRATKSVQTFTVLYRFRGGKDGASPAADLIDVGGTLYGTTRGGGHLNQHYCYVYAYNGCGTVFALSLSGEQRVLYRFNGNPDGAIPYSALINVNGSLYGTTLSGGVYDSDFTGGTVYKITTSGKETVLLSFGGQDGGSYPIAGLTNLNGTLYGTTQGFWSSGCLGYCQGTVYKTTTSGKESLLYTFPPYSKYSQPDSPYPNADLTNVHGTLYSTAGNGSAYGGGEVYKITTSGKETQLYSFGATPTDGDYPYGGLINVNGTLYGTTEYGGEYGAGTIFKITPSGAYSQLYSFGRTPTDGKYPTGGLINVNGTLYGTTQKGGSNGSGTIFAFLKKSGQELVIYSFTGGRDGGGPEAGLINIGGTLYGTTAAGGVNNNGTVFSLSL